jgi:AcrR family transcriptional regulator
VAGKGLGEVAARARGGGGPTRARGGAQRRAGATQGRAATGPRGASVAVSNGAAGGNVDRGGGRGGVAEIQRARMIAALVEVTRERGMGAVTVAHVVARSGVSRRTFYELFEDREDCFLAAFDLAVERAAQRVVPAFRGQGSWRERIRAGLGALLGFLDDEPGLGALCMVDALGAGPAALERRAGVVQGLIDAVDEGRAEAKGSAQPTRLTAEGVVGAVLAVLHARLASGDARVVEASNDGHARVNGARAAGAHATGAQIGGAPRRGSRDNGPRRDGARLGAAQPMVTLLGPLMGMIVLPYHGHAAATRETTRPGPRRRRIVAPRGDPLRDLDMRLTYRTVRVLLAVATHPGASNRKVADASGVADQGQISKLLVRLEHLGLVVNGGASSARGEPNVWSLTAKGEGIQRAIGRQGASVKGR